MIENNKKKEKLKKITHNYNDLKLDEIYKLFLNAKSPVLYFGSGVKSSNNYEHLNKLIEITNIPFMKTWMSFDV